MADQRPSVLSEQGWNDMVNRLGAVLDLHRPAPGEGLRCQEDGATWPCQTFRAVTADNDPSGQVSS